MFDTLRERTEQRMQKCIEAMNTELSKLRTGRISPSLVEHLRVDCYGSAMPLAQLASITTEGARTLLISPWDKSVISSIEKALMASDLGLTPTTKGMLIRVNFPPLNAERRKELVRVVRQIVESAKVAVRSVRRDEKADVKRLLKDKEITEDEEKRAETDIQKITDTFIGKINSILSKKESELLNT